MANRRRSILLRLTGDPSDAKRALRETRQELKDFAGISAEARAEIKTAAAEAQLEALKARLERLGKQEVTAKVKISTARTLEQIERIERKLTELGARNVEVDVDVRRGSLERLTGMFGGIAQGAAAGLGGLLGRLPGIGGLFQGLQSSFGTTAIGATAATAAIVGFATILAALTASLGAAAAGLGALAIAFAAALGPAVLVTIGAFARFAQIIKAVKDHQSNAGAETRGLAGSQDQLTAATDAVSQAQTNLKEQTTAAYRAWADSIETVKDDLLDVQHAQLGIEESQLRLKEAQQALRKFRAELAGGGPALFKKPTDVASHGVQGQPAKGGSLGADQSLELQRLILDVKEAKLGEKDAADRLHDSNVKLSRDRKTEVDFTQRGIKAYAPYRAALQQVASAQRGLASAQRASAGAMERQTKAWDALTPAEKTFGKLLLSLQDTFKKVFTPVMAALLDGVTRGLQSFATAAKDPAIKGALVQTGKALGDSFATLAKVLTSPEMRRAFVDLADAGVKIIRGFGSRVFEDLALILVRLATATLPLLLQFLDRVADWFDTLEQGSRNTKNLRDDVKHLVDTFNDWVTLLGQTAKFLLAIGKFLEPIGTGIVRFLSHPIESLGKLFGTTKRDMRDFGKAISPLVETVKEMASGISGQFRGVLKVIRGVVKLISGVLTLDFKEAFSGVGDIVSGMLENVRGLFRQAIAPFHLLGKHVGGAIVRGLKSAFDGVIGFIEDRINNLIDAANLLPGPDLPHVGQHSVDTTAGGGSAAGDAVGNFGAALGAKIKHRARPHRPTPGERQVARTSSLASLSVGDLFAGLSGVTGLGGAAGALAGTASAGGGDVYVDKLVMPKTAAPTVDERYDAVKLHRHLRRLNSALPA